MLALSNIHVIETLKIKRR